MIECVEPNTRTMDDRVKIARKSLRKVKGEDNLKIIIDVGGAIE
jgi:hypothetical protein